MGDRPDRGSSNPLTGTVDDTKIDRAVAVGASAGGVGALLELVAALPPDLPAPVLVVLHQPADSATLLPQLLARRSGLPVAHAVDGESLSPGRVYVAPPDRHLLVDKGSAVLSRGPKENGHRPAIDPLLRSIALHIGRGAVGVILSGTLDDGASGVLDVVRHGGTAMVQDPDQALYPSMPRAALDQVPGALRATAANLGATLPHLLAQTHTGPATEVASTRLAWEVAVAKMETYEPTDASMHGTPAGLACPDCSGPLFEIDDARSVRYRCRVGHAWSQAGLGTEQDESVETALYMALRALEDKAALQRRIAETADGQGATRVVARARDAADDAARSATVLRRLLARTPATGTDRKKDSTR